MNFSASGIPGGAFFMYFCAFWLLPKFNTRYNVNLMFAKSLFSEICTQKAHFAQLGAVLGSIRRAGRCCGRGAPFYTSLPKSKGHPLPESRMILREKISGKVKLGLYYVLLFHDSGIYPVFLTISHEDLFHVEGYFLMMTAWRFVCPALFSSLCLWFPRFSGFALAFTRHFRADFRLYYGI